MLDNQLSKILSLDGAWEFSLGSQMQGVPGDWGTIQVPGCWEAQGYSKVTDGPAHYRRSIFIPKDWNGERIFIEFDAVSYACQVRVNGAGVGEHRGLWTHFGFDITTFIRPGQENLIELEVYKPGELYPVRSCLAGFIPDVATTFGGIWQAARLRALSVGLQDVQVDPDPISGRVRIRCQAVSPGRELGEGVWEISITVGGVPAATQHLPLSANGSLDTTLTVTNRIQWSPDSPALYKVRLQLIQGKKTAARITQRFGFCRIETNAGLVTVNGQPALLRGVLSWGWQPDRIAPAYSAEQARAEIQRVKALGFNLIKLCLFVPNQTYFDIADEEGIFLWEELPLWLPEVTSDLRSRAPEEYAAITRLARHHPAIVLYSLGCELSQSVDTDLLGKLNAAVRANLTNGLVCDNSGSGESYGGLDFDFSDFTDYHPYYDLHYFEPLLDNWRRDWLPARPWIFGEFNDSDGYRSTGELSAANSGKLPWWLTADNPVTTWRPEARAAVEAEERLALADIGLRDDELVRIAADQSLVVHKYTLETLRKRASMGGYVITGLRDTPIATSGVFDDFDRPKWPAEDVCAFNAEVILCLDTGRRRRWMNGGDRPDRMDVYNHWAGSQARWNIILSAFGPSLEAGGRVEWCLSDLAGTPLQSGEVSVTRPVASGTPVEVAAITCPLPQVEKAAELRLEANLTAGRVQTRNNWPVWVYPPVQWPAGIEIPPGIGVYDPADSLADLAGLIHKPTRLSPGWNWRVPLVVATAWCESLEDHLRCGGNVLLLQQGESPLPTRRSPFWRENLKLFRDHPVWEVFPHQGYTSMQFFSLASDVVFDTSRLPNHIPWFSGLRPIMRRLDARDFNMADYLLEVNVGKGTLLACSLRLQGGNGAQSSSPPRNVAGTFLFWVLVSYLSSLQPSDLSLC